MKKLFLFLLKKYTKTELDRIEVFKILHERVTDTYREQTTFGNLYNANIEFIMANELVNRLVKEKDTGGLLMIKGGLSNSLTEALMYIETDNTNSEKDEL